MNPKYSGKRTPSLAILLTLMSLFFFSCNMEVKSDQAKKEETTSSKKKADEAVPVEITPLERGSLEASLRATANLVAEETVMVPARTSNRVLNILVEEGDKVSKNQVLLRLENDAQKTALERTRVQLDKARREHKRQKSLFDQKLISDQEYNNATANLEELELTFKDNQRELDYTVVRAPIAGTITQRMINQGDQISMNQNLFEIIDFNSIVARIFVPEKNLPALRERLKARVSSTALGGETYDGYVLRVAPTVDAKTGTVKVTVGLNQIGMLRPGLFVDVELILEVRENALLIPKKALVYDDADMYVFSVNDDMRVSRKQVTPRLTDRFFVEPTSGFEDGENIVIAGQAGLKDGALVKLPGTESPENPGDQEPESTATQAVSEN